MNGPVGQILPMAILNTHIRTYTPKFVPFSGKILYKYCPPFSRLFQVIERDCSRGCWRRGRPQHPFPVPQEGDLPVGDGCDHCLHRLPLHPIRRHCLHMPPEDQGPFHRRGEGAPAGGLADHRRPRVPSRIQLRVRICPRCWVVVVGAKSLRSSGHHWKVLPT